MKNFCLTVFILLLVFVPLKSQDAAEESFELNEIVLGTIPMDSLSTQATSHPDVKALCIGLANYFPSQSAWAALDFCTQWSNDQDWNILFVVANYSNKNVPIKVEMEMMYKNGGTRFYKKLGRTIQSGYIMLYYGNVTGKVKTKGLFTLNGRIHGNGLGNTNEVKSQVYIY